MTDLCEGSEHSYTISEDGMSITFQPCGRTSYHPADVKFRYCGHCHRFIDQVIDNEKRSPLTETDSPAYWRGYADAIKNIKSAIENGRFMEFLEETKGKSQIGDEAC